MFKGHINAARYTRYPFTDASTMLDVAGRELPSGAIVDASVYVYEKSDGPYVSRIDTTSNTVEVSAGGSLVCAGVYDADGVAYLESVPDGFSAGVVELDPVALGGGTYVLESGAADLLPSCFWQLESAGVLALRAGTGVVDGIVRLVGTGGVSIHTAKDEYTDTVRVDVRGCDRSDFENSECDTRPFIQGIRIVHTANALLRAAYDRGVLSITTRPGFELEALCPREMLPDDDGILPGRNATVCDEEVAAEEVEHTVPPPVHFFLPKDGHFSVRTPISEAYLNPVLFESVPTRAGGIDTEALRQVGRNVNSDLFARRAENLLSAAARPYGTFVVAFRGGSQHASPRET